MDPDRLDALLADAVAAEAGRIRASQRHLRQAAQEEATFAGTLVDLAERAAAVTVHTTDRRAHHGTTAAVGRDFVVVRDGDRPPVIVASRAIAFVREHVRLRADTAGDRKAPVDTTFSILLAGLAGDRPLVQLGVSGSDNLWLGELRAVGRDVVTFGLEAESGATLYVPLASVTELVVMER